MTAWKLRGLERMAEYPEAGKTPDDPVVVSLIGWPSLSNQSLSAEPGRQYDWTPLAGLYAVLLTRKGVDSGNAVRGLFRTAFSVTLKDADTGWMTDILQLDPKPIIWRWRPNAAR